MSAAEDFANEVMISIASALSSEQARTVEQTLYEVIYRYDVTRREMQCTDLSVEYNQNIRAYQLFFIAKKVEGLRERSLEQYKYTIDKFMRMFPKPFEAITANDIRYFIAMRKGVKATTIDNERRNLSTFFAWLAIEEYIPKNPMLKIKAIKKPKVVRKPFSGKEIEELRDACNDRRERAIIEVLLSTGMRAGELQGANRDDVSGNEIIVTGKGDKQRICYLNPQALKRINDYLAERNDDYTPLIIANAQGNARSKKYGYRVGVGCFEVIVRGIGRRAGVSNTHPHRFRRTAATMAIQRGMPIEQVRVMLGHESIDTTLLYAMMADETVKHSHSKYM